MSGRYPKSLSGILVLSLGGALVAHLMNQGRPAVASPAVASEDAKVLVEAPCAPGDQAGLTPCPTLVNQVSDAITSQLDKKIQHLYRGVKINIFETVDENHPVGRPFPLPVCNLLDGEGLTTAVETGEHKTTNCKAPESADHQHSCGNWARVQMDGDTPLVLYRDGHGTYEAGLRRGAWVQILKCTRKKLLEELRTRNSIAVSVGCRAFARDGRDSFENLKEAADQIISQQVAGKTIDVAGVDYCDESRNGLTDLDPVSARHMQAACYVQQARNFSEAAFSHIAMCELNGRAAAIYNEHFIEKLEVFERRMKDHLNGPCKSRAEDDCSSRSCAIRKMTECYRSKYAEFFKEYMESVLPDGGECGASLNPASPAFTDPEAPVPASAANLVIFAGLLGFLRRRRAAAPRSVAVFGLLTLALLAGACSNDPKPSRHCLGEDGIEINDLAKAALCCETTESPPRGPYYRFIGWHLRKDGVDHLFPDFTDDEDAMAATSAPAPNATQRAWMDKFGRWVASGPIGPGHATRSHMSLFFTANGSASDKQKYYDLRQSAPLGSLDRPTRRNVVVRREPVSSPTHPATPREYTNASWDLFFEECGVPDNGSGFVRLSSGGRPCKPAFERFNTVAQTFGAAESPPPEGCPGAADDPVEQADFSDEGAGFVARAGHALGLARKQVSQKRDVKPGDAPLPVQSAAQGSGGEFENLFADRMGKKDQGAGPDIPRSPGSSGGGGGGSGGFLGSGGSLGGLDGGTSTSSVPDESDSADETMGVESSAAYSGGGGGGSRYSSAGGLFGGAGGGSAGHAMTAATDLELGGSKAGGIENPMGSSDPEDYFGLIDPSSNLFKVVERRYRRQQFSWAEAAADRALKSIRKPAAK